MAESEAVAKMADLAARKIFAIFGWDDLKHRNRNWECVNQKKHNRQKSKTHPADVVFRYVDPYSGRDVYVHTDLKSYKKSTLEATDLKKALRSLATAIECASTSAGWQNLFLDDTRNSEIVGMLFVFNHDGGYDADFEGRLEAITPAAIELPNNRFIGVVSPKRVIYLNSIASDVQCLIADKEIPHLEDCFFFFPHLMECGAVHPHSRALPLQHMLSPLIVFGYKPTAKRPQGGVIAYSDGHGSSVDEFKYLLDYFIRHQIADGKKRVEVMFSRLDVGAAGHFETAKREFIRDYWPLAGDEKADAVKTISSVSLNTIQSSVPSFSEEILGMAEHSY